MDIILLERVEKLGSIGDIVTVKNGYARNFLLPNKKALRANAANKKVFEANRQQIEADNEAKRKEAEAASGSIEGKQIVLIRASSASGQLYGSVSVRDIVEALNADGKSSVVEKSMVILEKPIKTLGVFDVRVRLHPEVNVTIQANVARSDDEADLQKDGVDVIAQMFEEDQAELAANALAPDSEDDAQEAGEEATSEAADETAETEEQDDTETKE
ncbi:50S ribosomal protein L9 [Parasphingorhabdus flavimaris]|jgi:large subunit ribosomal protein L9|uniref:Large ribosomal subunit protein bL9 n=1 Tax=Parasphingorhabdus flavimaris TaxID=266812 RepID=A0ABX2N1X6_9SPHN|nr:50S ribosomal protein L9 [Parasphingorhabdus flavimaris]NVD27722.1 50S ribosomal protein L9 [Parasphingorhabdus flavimaris]|tara:strand:+ start:2293 stop:2940 length:648 start_codon:yes stop_codon:yes gene_type:complete